MAEFDRDPNLNPQVYYSSGRGTSGQPGYMAPGFYTSQEGGPGWIPGVGGVNAIPPAVAGTAPAGTTSTAPATAPATSQDLLQSFWNQFFGSGGPSDSSGGTTSGAGLSNILSKLMEGESQFIPEMLSGNYRSTQAGAAAYESAASPINSKFDALKEQVLQNAARQGVAPGSGIVQQQLNNIEHERTQALSDLERQFNASLPQRQEAGLSQLTNLLGIEQQRQLQELGIAQSLDEAQRQRILDAATLGGNQGAAAAEQAGGLASGLLGAASNLSSLYGQRAADQSYGLGSMLGSMGNYFNQPQSPSPISSLYGGENTYVPQYVNQPGDIYQGSAPTFWGGSHGAQY